MVFTSAWLVLTVMGGVTYSFTESDLDEFLKPDGHINLRRLPVLLIDLLACFRWR